MQDEVKVTQADALTREFMRENGIAAHWDTEEIYSTFARWLVVRLSTVAKEGLRIDAKQADVLHRAHLASMEMTHTPEAADEIASLRARVAELEGVVERAIRQAQNIGIDSGSYYETLRAALAAAGGGNGK